ncbi:MAG: RNA polymerase sigma factor [Thiotrichales bacterium]|nr:RNA polymerase sigma factor [Thiotrichales bacterium]
MAVSPPKPGQILDPSEEEAQRDQKDRALIERISLERDHTAMETLYVLYRPRLGSFLRRLTHDNTLIEEAYNDVMMKVWNKGHQYQGQSKVSSWVFSIAYRTCLRMVKKQKTRNGLFDIFGEKEVVEDIASDERIDESLERTDLIEQALQTLSPKHRLVIELCYFSGYSTEEVGKIVQCPTNTVKTRLHHARKKVRSFVEESTEK